MTEKEANIAEQALKRAQPGAVSDITDSADEQGANALPPFQKSDALGGRTFSVAQRILVLGALLIFSFSVYDTYSNQPESMPAPEPQPFDSLDTRIGPDTMPLSATIDLFETRRIFGPPPADTEPTVEEEAPVRGWRAEVRDHWRLKGSSEVPSATDDVVLEAIVFDGRAERLQFLRVGETVRIADRDVEVTRVEVDRIELRREDEILVLD